MFANNRKKFFRSLGKEQISVERTQLTDILAHHLGEQ